MDNKILNMKMTNFQPESRDMAIFGKSPCQKVSGVSESMDGRRCAILALEVVPKNLFYKILCLLFQQGKQCLTNM